MQDESSESVPPRSPSVPRSLSALHPPAPRSIDLQERGRGAPCMLELLGNHHVARASAQESTVAGYKMEVQVDAFVIRRASMVSRSISGVWAKQSLSIVRASTQGAARPSRGP